MAKQSRMATKLTQVTETIQKKPAHQMFDSSNNKTTPQGSRRITPTEFQYRKDHNLCFKCGEKFSPGHVCRNKGIHLLLADEGEAQVEEVADEEDEVIEFKATSMAGILHYPSTQFLANCLPVPLRCWEIMVIKRCQSCWMEVAPTAS